MKPIQVAVINYTNSLPFVYGLRNFRPSLEDAFTIQQDVPAVCTQKLMDGCVDIALISSVGLLKLPFYKRINNFCISASGPVKSVYLYSHAPFEQIRSVQLDPQSRTSNALAKVLFRLINKQHVEYIPPESTEIADAQILIGDRALAVNSTHKHVYDLAWLWRKQTGRPFVFALWVTNKTIPAERLLTFNAALDFGLQNIPYCIQQLEIHKPAATVPWKEYFNVNIEYLLTHEKEEALRYFLSLLKEYKIEI